MGDVFYSALQIEKMNHIPNISYTTRNKLCTGCGICKDTCPFGAISFTGDKGCFRPVVDTLKCRNKSGCHKCYSVCPGVGVKLSELGSNIFLDTKANLLTGRYLSCYSGYSCDDSIRLHSASGGLVSQILISLLEREVIDGAVVTKFDMEAPFHVKTFIATSREEILSAKSSKYAPVAFTDVISSIKKTEGNRYIVVGLPCHIEALRKYENTDSKFKQKIFGYFAIYCSSGRSYYLTERVCEERGFETNQLTNFAYRDNGCLGNMVAHYIQDGKKKKWEEPFESYYQPLVSLFVPIRCKLCIDHYGELADISFGDIHIPPYTDDKIGVNSMIIRSHKFLKLIENIAADGEISIDKISVDVVNKSQPMASVKKSRNLVFCKIRDFFGKKTPDYGIKVLPKPNIKMVNWYIISQLQHFIGFHKVLWFFIPFIKKLFSSK